MGKPVPNIDLLFRPATLPGLWGRRRSASFGLLPLPTGRLIVSDPLELERSPSFPVPPGEHELLLAFVEYEIGGTFYPEIAAVRLNITDAEVASWTAALVNGEPYCAGIDSACACFADAAIAEELRGLGDNRIAEIWGAFTVESAPQLVEMPGGRAFFFLTEDDGGLPLYQGLDSSGALVSVAVVLPRASFEVGIDYDPSFFGGGGE